ncbi:DNA mismatch repair protein MSH3 [Mycena sp. CBHHK59/15]|nr:DNA mismatch repair protein MSH3 [Mycena sp. CBHHK59/15]
MPSTDSSSSPSRQVKISNFFSQTSSDSNRKRPSSPGGVHNVRDSNEPPSKKQKALPVAGSSKGGRSTERWRFIPSSSENPTTSSMVPAASNTLREAFKKKLLSDNNNPLARPNPRNQIHMETKDSDPEFSYGDSDHAFEELSTLFSKKSGKGKKAVPRPKPVEPVGPSGETFTPLEKQVMGLKRDNLGALLMVEVGYRYKFFGEDAEVAAKELGMVCYTDRNFLVASIPTHRRDIHLKKLLSQGYKVGIVQQVETAALKKAGDNRNTPFDRKLLHLYTAATYVDGLDSADDLDKYSSPRVVCLIEEKSQRTGSGVDVCIGMISVSPSTGDVVWDAFDDSPMRIELEVSVAYKTRSRLTDSRSPKTRLVHSKPTELLLQKNGLSKSTEKMLGHYTEVTATDSRIRTEHFKEAMPFSEAFEFVTTFYTSRRRPDFDDFGNGKLLAEITDFPRPVVIALAHAIKYLSAFDIAVSCSEARFFSKFTTKSHMLLAGNTLANLEIFRNETDYATRGSLMWILDRTVTTFGAKMLKSWVGKPLVDKCALQDRIAAVEEILSSSSDKLVSLRQLLKGLPDLAKGLCRIQYKQCTPQELAVLLAAFNKIANTFVGIETSADVGLKSRLLNEIVLSLPPLKQPMKDLLDAVKLKQAAEGRKDCMWKDPSKFPALEDNIIAIQAVEMELDDELKAIRKVLKMPSLKWSSATGEDYLIEVKKSDNRPIPASYHPAISKTKYMERYRSPEVKLKLQERAQWQESLQIEANRAFSTFLEEVTSHYAIMRDAVNKLAVADCLISLAQVALRANYVRPEFTDDDSLAIVDGRHPMVEALKSDPFIANTVDMGGKEPRSKIITGPNMGGKSSCVRMIALIAIMAQIGSYVPAASVKLGMLDSILTRMGANDSIIQGRSTFMVEMTDTSEVLHTATSNSLVILDELGRGTSTFDGMAIAYAVLHQLVASTRCKTLFITHYPVVALELEKKFPESLQNIHVGYQIDQRIDGRRDVTFLYRMTNGIASESFGVECARLAGLPESILDNAKTQSSQLETQVGARAKRNRIIRSLQLLKQCLREDVSAAAAVRELLVTTKSIARDN